jgi:MinD-like ATPase involved in chromosome partitioning or flagellar assembly
MIILCRSVKGGAGTTVTAAALGLLLSARHRGGGHVVDLQGDMPAALGIAEPESAAACEVNSALRLLPRRIEDNASETQWLSLVTELQSLRGPVVVDAGTKLLGSALIDAAAATYLVTRPCYLALRRATTAIHRGGFVVDGCILVNEPGRALTSNDVATVLRTPVRAEIPVDSTISRAVDAGLLAHRVPRALDEGLADLITEHGTK